jgi:hypothetical protein
MSRESVQWESGDEVDSCFSHCRVNATAVAFEEAQGRCLNLCGSGVDSVNAVINSSVP